MSCMSFSRENCLKDVADVIVGEVVDDGSPRTNQLVNVDTPFIHCTQSCRVVRLNVPRKFAASACSSFSKAGSNARAPALLCKFHFMCVPNFVDGPLYSSSSPPLLPLRRQPPRPTIFHPISHFPRLHNPIQTSSLDHSRRYLPFRVFF